jgi:hypothetical protein
MGKSMMVYLGKKSINYRLKLIFLMFGFIWILIMSCIVSMNKPLDNSRLSVGYFPPLIRIPDSVYNLSRLIAKGLINLPMIPTEIIELNLNVLSVRVSRLRAGGSATFVLAKQKKEINIDFWCLFDDQLITPVYRYHIQKFSFLECSLPHSIIQRLWYNRLIDQEIKIYLATSEKLLLEGLLDIPWSNWAEDTEQSVTVCTDSLHIELTYFIQWIEYHRLIGISKFIIYNISNLNNRFSSKLNSYNEDYPSLIDIIQWNFSSMEEIPYDCFIRYGDISEWITRININEYLIPQIPYDNLPKLLTEQYGRQLQTIVNFETHHFCPDIQWKPLLIEQYISRSNVSKHSNKYLYRPRAIDDLSINRDINPMEKTIVLAHYPVMEDDQMLSNCLENDDLVEDTTIRDRFAKRLFNEISIK